MGIYDRDYTFRNTQRGGFGSVSRFSANIWLIIVNVAVLLLAFVSPRAGQFLFEHGHFSTHEVTLAGGLEFWRFLTFQFLHGGVVHLFFNMLGLYMFGAMVEQHLGSKRYLAFYLTCGVFGGLMYLILNGAGTALASMGMPRIPGLLFTDPKTPLVGASAGVFGVILACAYISPNSRVQLLFPPVPMRLKTFAYVYVGIAAVSLLMNSKNAGGEAAHLGGAIAGAFFIRNAHLLRDFFDVFSDSRKADRAARTRMREARRTETDGSRNQLRAEVERILNKVDREGIHSLTEHEKSVLRRDNDARASGTT